jgi:hypothetical protein
VVVVPDVLPDGLGIVLLEGRPTKLLRWDPGDALPECLCTRQVGAFVDVDAADQAIRRVTPATARKRRKKTIRRGSLLTKMIRS